MSQVPGSAVDNVQPAPPAQGRSALWWLVPLLILVAAGGAGGYSYYVLNSISPVHFPKHMQAAISNPAGLDKEFSDENDDMLADPPKDKAQLVSPDVLFFSVLEHQDKRDAVWKEFIAHLEKQTGKKVELVDTPPGGVGIANMMKEGKLHIAALSTGAVPLAVNTAGFVPVCVPADAKGEFHYEMEILVRPDSPIQKLADLRGKELWLSSMSSLSAFKAPVMTLWTQEQMLPGRDYEFRISQGQTSSIEHLLKGEYEAIAVANDLLAREIQTRAEDEKSKDIYKKENYRSIYKSPSYPPVCFGHVYNLDSELAGKIREAFLGFQWEGTGVEKEFGPAGATQFKEIEYKKDWAPVREIDKALLDLVNQKG